MSDIVVPPPARAITIRRRTFGFVVSPGTFRIDPAVGETPHIKLRNRAFLEARITFPPEVLVLDDQGNPVASPFTIAHGANKRLTIDTAHPPEFFEYKVEMIAAGIEAQGNSRPGVEIVP